MNQKPNKQGKTNAKTTIISMRVTDDEMETVQKVIALTNQRASSVMREAFQILLSRWQEAHPAPR
jgi:CBS domain containing-hemolysin-like protein